jgi:hypothetical protein
MVEMPNIGSGLHAGTYEQSKKYSILTFVHNSALVENSGFVP